MLKQQALGTLSQPNYRCGSARSGHT